MQNKSQVMLQTDFQRKIHSQHGTAVYLIWNKRDDCQWLPIHSLIRRCPHPILEFEEFHIKDSPYPEILIRSNSSDLDRRISTMSSSHPSNLKNPKTFSNRLHNVLPQAIKFCQ